jgi:hypothetical protein
MAIAKQVVDWFRSVFPDANRDACERIYRVPGTPEPHLDTGFVSYLMNYAGHAASQVAGQFGSTSITSAACGTGGPGR